MPILHTKVHAPAINLSAIIGPILFAMWQNGHPRAISTSNRTKKVPISSNGLLHKVGEVERVANITEQKVIDFRWRDVITKCRFPRSIIVDNGRQSIGKRMKEYCKHLGIFGFNPPVARSQANGYAVATNKPIIQALRKENNQRCQKNLGR